MGHEIPPSRNSLATNAPGYCSDSDTGDESGDDCSSLPSGSGSRPASTLISEAPPLSAFSSEGLAGAFYSASFKIAPREAVRLGVCGAPGAEIFRDEKFYQAWGYQDSSEMKRLIGCLDDNDRPNLKARELYRPLRQWAFQGKITKQQFCEMKKDYFFEPYFKLFAQGALSDDQLWKVADLYLGRRGHKFNSFSLTGMLSAYSKGALSFEELQGLCQRDSRLQKQYAAELFPKLLDSGALSKDWGPYEDELANAIGYLDLALGGFTDPIAWSLCFAPGDSWDEDVASQYFGVKDLSRVTVTRADYDRADHSREAGGRAHFVGNSVIWALRGNQNHNLLLTTEVHRRLERERAAGVNTELEPPSTELKRGNTLAREIKKACVLF